MARVLSTFSDLGPDVPEYVAEELKSLRDIDSFIEELEASLETARHNRIEICMRLARYQATRAPIFRLPTEILSQIFQYNPEDISRNCTLMLVCKSWNWVLTGSPILWSNIVLTMESTKDVPRCWSYALSCVEHSGDTLLDIRIDASNLEITEFPTLVHCYHLPAYSRAYYPDPDSRFWRLINALDNSQRSEEKQCEATIQMTFNILRGFENEFMSRWRSFHVETLYRLTRRSAIMLWNSIDHPTENLTALVFKAFDTMQEQIDEEPGLRGFPSLPALKQLDLNLSIPLGAMSFSPRALDRLSLMDQASSRHFFLSTGHRYTHLRTLELYFPHTWQLPESIRPVDLFSLQTLTLWGHCHAPLTSKLNAPNLHHLYIMSSPQICYEACSLLSPSVTDLYWDAVVSPGQVSWNALKFLLTHLPSLRRIRFRVQSQWGVSLELRLIDELRVNGVPLSHLKHLHLVPEHHSFFTNMGVQLVDVSPPLWLAYLTGRPPVSTERDLDNYTFIVNL